MRTSMGVRRAEQFTKRFQLGYLCMKKRDKSDIIECVMNLTVRVRNRMTSGNGMTLLDSALSN